jgi:toxin ParE1/3/4
VVCVGLVAGNRSTLTGWYNGKTGEGIAEYDPTRAMQVLTDLEEQCQALAALPMMGRERDELAPRLRSLPLSPYVIFYYPLQNGVDIARILHSSRDAESVFWYK